MNSITCLLPGGYVDEAGGVHQYVELAPLSGKEEEFLAGKPASPVLVTALLNRCIRRMGTISPVSKEVTRNLIVADRQYLLLKLREATFGEQVQASIHCPLPECGERIDFDFSIADIPITASEDKGPIHKMELSPEAAFVGDGGQRYREITFRLPNGGDEEVISPLLDENEEKASAILLGRCLQSIGPLKPPGDEQIGQLSLVARMEIERQMEAVAPQVELTMGANCPECGREFAIPFDLQGFFFNELRTSQDLLYREVHYLAYHYHWSERELMEMPREKRRKYIEVLAEEIERVNNAV